MENPGILKWRQWSVVRKAQVVGAAVGLLFPLGVTLLSAVTGPHELFDFYHVLAAFAFALPLSIMRSLGFEAIIYNGENGYSWSTFALAIVISSFLYFVAGTAIGLLMNVRKSHRR
jgi:NO-binding membrane sensor protein with MHYT domain